MDTPSHELWLLGLPPLESIGQVALGIGVMQPARSRDGSTSPPAFLSPEERATFATLRFAKRKADWLLGRLTVKRLAQRLARATEQADLPLETISVEAAPDGAPTLSLHDGRASALGRRSVSLSHSAAVAFCALSAGSTVGVDLELIEPRSPSFAADYFTAEEQQQLAACGSGERSMVLTALWSAKEAVLKAHRLGLTVDTRALSCRLERRRRRGWQRFGWSWDETRSEPSDPGTARAAGAGFWRKAGRFVLTVAELGVLAPVGAA